MRRVANRDDNTVTEIRPSDGASLGTFVVPATPVAIAYDGASGVWIASSTGGSITELRISDGAVVRTISIFQPQALISDGANIWVSSSPLIGQLTKIDHVTGATTNYYFNAPTDLKPSNLLFDGTNIWFSAANTGLLTKLSTADGSNLGTFPVYGYGGPSANLPAHMTFDGTYIWVCAAYPGTGTLYPMRASDGSPAPFVPVSSQNVIGFPVGCGIDSGVYFDGTSIWTGGPIQNPSTLPAYDASVVHGGDGTGFRQLLLGEPGGLITGIVSDGTRLWFTDAYSNTIIRQ